MRIKYYFPINATSLAHYFGSACIKPAKYFTNKPKGIQDNYSDFLLITDKKGSHSADCCLELVFTDSEVKELISIGIGWYLYGINPLPISRVRQIIFADRAKMETTITNIEMSTAFIPKQLVTLISSFEQNELSSINTAKVGSAADMYSDILKFDRFLGGLALLRFAKDDKKIYSKDYVATLSLFNNEIKHQLELQHLSSGTKLQGIFTRRYGFENILKYLDKIIGEEDLSQIASVYNQKISKDPITRLVNLDEIEDGSTYTIAVLSTYGVGSESKKKRIDELITTNFSKLIEGKSEGVALCYGYNRGYSAFSKSYKDVAVKYELNSQLDYYTIESVYQYVFNNVQISDLFPYLDSWIPESKDYRNRKSDDIIILDTIIGKKKKTKVLSKEYWTQLLPGFLKTIDLANTTPRDLCENLGGILYDDIKEEICSDNSIIASYDEPICTELNKNNTTSDVSLKESETEQEELNISSTLSVEDIVDKTLYYKGKKLAELKVEAKERGLSLSTKAKVDEIIKMLMTCKYESNTIKFDE